MVIDSLFCIRHAAVADLYGITVENFKTRYRNHTASFRHSHLRNSTELSKHIWKLKDSKVNYSLSWRIH